MPWYQRCGIEPPLPLRSVLAWPVLWAYGWIAEKLHRPIVHVPTPLDVLEPGKATFRLWDKNYNLLCTWQQDEKLHLTRDHKGSRWSGLVTDIQAARGPQDD